MGFGYRKPQRLQKTVKGRKTDARTPYTIPHQMQSFNGGSAWNRHRVDLPNKPAPSQNYATFTE